MRKSKTFVSHIPAADRSPDKNWAGSDVIRVQSYKGPNDKSLFMGAELPISSPEVFGDFIAALCAVYVQGKTGI
jgi:hypothetical protein